MAGTDFSFELVQQANALCGEGPIWDWRRQLLYWIDLDRPAAYCFDPLRGEQVGNWPLDSRAGALALAADGRLAITTRDRGIGLLDPTSGAVEHLVNPAQAKGPGIYNDGRVDPKGRLWAGWITEDRTHPGAVFRVEASGASTEAVADLHASNGMGWSPDGRTMYFTDSKSCSVYAAEFEMESGRLGSRRTFLQLSPEKGIPDGLAVDDQGCVWIALYLGWHILCLDPDGKLIRELKTPVLKPTSLAFGGPNLDVLYVTSAIRRHSAGELMTQPWAGALMAIRPGVAGQPESLFG